jgi:uncharacterized protein (TIGR02145 family)
MKKVLTLLLLFCAAAFAQNTFTDQRDGKKYKTVKMGEQIWMSQNLDYAGEDGNIGVCSDNDPKNCQKYGRLYNWEDAMLACPDGWHLPDYYEWQALANFAGGGVAGQKLKAKSGWEKWDCEWTSVDDRGRTKKNSKCNSDNYSFSALPSSNEGQSGFWWAASENYSGATAIIMVYNSENVRQNNYGKSQTLSVRCLKGEGKLPDKIAAKKTALATAEATKKAEKAAEAANPLTTEITNEGTVLRGSTLAKKLAWLDRSAESHNTYFIEVNANENIAQHTFEYKGAINITIILIGDDENRTIRLKSHGTMFTVKQNVTFVLDNNITLHGHNGNTGNMVDVKGGKFEMYDGATITSNYGGVYMESGSFYMSGGIISGNGRSTDFFGGGVDVRNGTFTMSGGTISGNTAFQGGGVYLKDGTFTMSGGSISGNTAAGGGGIFITRGTFNMSGGSISGNISSGNGGGIDIDGNNHNSTINMSGGIIYGNTARGYGGGIAGWQVTFTKTAGTITGYNSDRSNGNVVRDDEGIIARRGHAVYVNEKWHKETTAEPEEKLSCYRNNCTGAWDD